MKARAAASPSSPVKLHLRGSHQEGLQKKLIMGNLEAKRDWGFAGDYVRHHVAYASAGSAK